MQKTLGLTGIGSVDLDLDWIWAIRSRSDGWGGSWRAGGGAVLPAARLAAVCGGGVAGVGQNGRPGRVSARA